MLTAHGTDSRKNNYIIERRKNYVEDSIYNISGN